MKTLINKTFDVIFNDGENSNSKGFKLTFEDCIDYINLYNGTNSSYFNDYKGGSVAIISNETGEMVYETTVF